MNSIGFRMFIVFTKLLTVGSNEFKQLNLRYSHADFMKNQIYTVDFMNLNIEIQIYTVMQIHVSG